jgi:hypothetical protein
MLGSKLSSSVALPRGPCGAPGCRNASLGATTPNRLQSSACGCHGSGVRWDDPTLSPGTTAAAGGGEDGGAAREAAAASRTVCTRLCWLEDAPEDAADACTAAPGEGEAQGAVMEGASAADWGEGRERPPGRAVAPNPGPWTSDEVNRLVMTLCVRCEKKLATLPNSAISVAASAEEPVAAERRQYAASDWRNASKRPCLRGSFW